MVDVVRDDGAAAGDSRCGRTRGDFLGIARRSSVPGCWRESRRASFRPGGRRARCCEALDVGAAIVVLADGDEFHFRRDDAAAGVRRTSPPAAACGGATGEAQFVRDLSWARVRQSPKSGPAASSSVSPRSRSSRRTARQAGADVDLGRRVRIGAGAIGLIDGRVLLAPKAVGVSAWAISRKGNLECPGAIPRYKLAGIGRAGSPLRPRGRGRRQVIPSVHGGSRRRGRTGKERAIRSLRRHARSFPRDSLSPVGHLTMRWKLLESVVQRAHQAGCHSVWSLQRQMRRITVRRPNLRITAEIGVQSVESREIKRKAGTSV